MNAPDFNKIETLYAKYEDRFKKFAELLGVYNKRYNLTSITDEKSVLYKHFFDSMAGLDEFYAESSVVEIGSGGGFPSIPLKIVRDDLRFTLVESTGKKCDFLRAAVAELGLKNVEVVHSRAEELGKNVHYREQFDVCCARAVARLNTLVEYCLPFVKIGGRFLAYKGEAEEEISEAKHAISLLGGSKVQYVRYALPENYGCRTLVSVQKASATPAAYPRGNGKERSKPIV
ncbi:MAG: 16S rRNA (guanine(527)-N(7))-methyltransferase RsmG [Clostridia bacterium]|nr:16S rRNA (guanine(527)-N(7))-methyltransferase RsmG [Clostridia bacterium]